MSGGKVCPHRFPAHTSLRKLGLHSRTHSPAIFHLDVARDVQATSIQCPPECLKKSRFSSNSRNCMGLFIPVTEHRRDIIFSRDFSSNHSPLPVLSPPTSLLPPLSQGLKIISWFDSFGNGMRSLNKIHSAIFLATKWCCYVLGMIVK